MTKSAFIKAARVGHLKTIQEIYYSGRWTDIHCDNEDPFRTACHYGRLRVAQWLYSLGGVDIHVRDDVIMYIACARGYFNMVKWLYSLDSKWPRAELNYAFLTLCRDGRLRMAQWFYGTGILDGEKVNWKRCCEVACDRSRFELLRWLAEVKRAEMLKMDCRPIGYCIERVRRWLYFKFGPRWPLEDGWNEVVSGTRAGLAVLGGLRLLLEHEREVMEYMGYW